MRYDNKNTLYYMPLGHISFTPVLTPLHLLTDANTLYLLTGVHALQPLTAKAHNHEAGGSGSAGSLKDRQLNFNIGEASILTKNNILVPPGWSLPHE
jgi:hypothetical protein